MWKCSNCGEQIENDFEVCWNCQFGKNGTLQDISEPSADATDAEPSAYWEIQVSVEQVSRYMSIDEIKVGILSGDISPDMLARYVELTQAKKGVDMPQWQKVSQGLAKSFFEIKVLFDPPIWAHVTRTAAIAAKIGVIVYLSIGAINFAPINPIISGWLWAFCLLWLYSFVPSDIRKPINGVLAKFPFLAPALIYFAVIGPALRAYGFEQFLKGSMIGLQSQLGATCAGAAFFVFPGMIIGTTIGAVRVRRLRRSPYAKPDKPHVFIKGVVVPIIAFALVIFLYVQFVSWAIP